MPTLLLLEALSGSDVGSVTIRLCLQSQGRFLLSSISKHYSPIPRAMLSLFSPKSLEGQRECVLSGEVSSGGGTRSGTRAQETKSRSHPPSWALPGPSRPHPGPRRAEWVGMTQNKKLIKSVSHLHPKIKERGKTSSDNSHAVSSSARWATVREGVRMGVGGAGVSRDA